MDNGCKFSPDKSVKVRLSFQPEGYPSIEISDKGPGIPEDEMARVFNAFYRSPGTRAIKGSGIGLSLVDSIMKLHHIHLQMKSKAGEGTTFILDFPLDNRLE
jgi:signal transduction histidine kinase